MSTITVYNYKFIRDNNLVFGTDTFVMDIMYSHGSVLGNPFYNRNDLTRSQKVDYFRIWFAEQMLTNTAVKEVVNSMTSAYTMGVSLALVCACKPQACHGDVIKAYIESAAGGIL